MRASIKKALDKIHLLGFVQDSLHDYRAALRKAKRTDQRIAREYFVSTESPKLHIGCGNNLIHGWLNTDFFPTRHSVFHLDATRAYPFADNTFCNIFSEHMIEHISYDDGIMMLQECWRVLRPGATIRVATPDFRFLIDLYTTRSSEISQEYIQWSCNRFVPHAPYPDAIFVVNNFFWGFHHLFVYDESALRASLVKAGFCDVKRCNINESEEPALRNLENETRMPPGFLKLETLVLEARKP